MSPVLVHDCPGRAALVIAEVQCMTLVNVASVACIFLVLNSTFANGGLPRSVLLSLTVRAMLIKGKRA